jgi:hypothetical protein
MYVPNLTAANEVDYYIGKAASAGQAGVIGYHYNTDTNTSYMYLANYGDGSTGVKIQKGGNTTIGGTLTSGGIISAPGASGFTSTTYVAAARNPIWRFGNADTYGISYFQGTAGARSNLDTITLHFGTATAAGSPYQFVSDGTASFSGGLSLGQLFRAVTGVVNEHTAIIHANASSDYWAGLFYSANDTSTVLLATNGTAFRVDAGGVTSALHVDGTTAATSIANGYSFCLDGTHCSVNLYTNGDSMVLRAGNGTTQIGSAVVSYNAFTPALDDTMFLGYTANRWKAVYATAYYAGANVAGVSCTSAAAVTTVGGIVTVCSEPEPESTPAALLSRIHQLEQQVAALAALVGGKQ